MKNYKIKVLKDTPFHKKGIELSVTDFRQVYSYICSSSVSNEHLICYLKDYKSHPQFLTPQGVCVSEWFEVVQVYEYIYRVGDWVWHKERKKAFCVMTHLAGKDWKPNYVSFEAANQYQSIYTRKATQEEIDDNDLVLFCDKQVLIGRKQSYYYNNTWKELSMVTTTIKKYISSIKSYTDIGCQETSWECKPNGLKVGCTTISHEEILQIAKHLKL